MKYPNWIRAIAMDSVALFLVCWPPTRHFGVLFLLVFYSFAILAKLAISRIPDEAFAKLDSTKKLAAITNKFYIYHFLTDVLLISLTINFGFYVIAAVFIVNHIASDNLLARAKRVFRVSN
jgi:hypothetical protein